MKVVHIGYKYGLNNTGGAAIAATRLHKALLAHGIESHYVCVWQCEDGENVHVLPRVGSIARQLYFFATRGLRGIWKFTHFRKAIPLNIIPLFGLEKLLKSIRPDIVHIHWINLDVMSFGQVAKLNYKIVMNLHDLFMINIIDAHPGKDRRYIEGVDQENASRLERWLFARKRGCVRTAKPIIIGPSEWVCECAWKSIVGADLHIHVISNLIDKNYSFNPNLRSEHGRFVILYGAYGGRRNKSKGFAELEKSLERLPSDIKEDCELWVFGEDSEVCHTGGVRTNFKGNINSLRELVNLYHSADVFVFPSVEETQGMSKVEAMLCGLPVVAFNRTACGEGIENDVTGYVVKDGDIGGFTDCLIKLYRKSKQMRIEDRLIYHQKIALLANKQFDGEKALRRIIDVYQGQI